MADAEIVAGDLHVEEAGAEMIVKPAKGRELDADLTKIADIDSGNMEVGIRCVLGAVAEDMHVAAELEYRRLQAG